MTPVEALELALAKEKSAIELYRKLAQEHPAIRDLLLLLLNEEEKHKILIAKKIVEVTKY